MSSRALRVLHVITSLDIGGAEMMLTRLLSALGADAREHSVVCLRRPGPLAQWIEDARVPVYSLEMRPGAPSLRALLRLRRLAKRLDPEVIHGWMYHGSLAASLARTSASVLWSIHHSASGLRLEKWRTRAVVRFLARISQSPEAILHCSAVSAREHARLGFPRDKATVVPNGFDCDRYRPDAESRRRVRRELGWERQLILGHVGRLHAAKDHANFLRAASRLSRTHSNLRFVLVGRGADKENSVMGELVVRAGLNGRVRLMGERSDVPRLMNAFDILVSSSRSESFPTVVGEAMACGVPCVATDCGDSVSLIGETGKVVPPGDPAALAEACADLIALDPAMRRGFGKAARTRIVTNFSMATIAARYTQLYAALAKRM